MVNCHECHVTGGRSLHLHFLCIFNYSTFLKYVLATCATTPSKLPHKYMSSRFPRRWRSRTLSSGLWRLLESCFQRFGENCCLHLLARNVSNHLQDYTAWQPKYCLQQATEQNGVYSNNDQALLSEDTRFEFRLGYWLSWGVRNIPLYFHAP